MLLSAALVLAACNPGSPSPTPTSGSPTTGGTTPISTPSPTAPAEPQTAADLITYIQAGSPVNAATYTSVGQASFSTPSRWRAPTWPWSAARASQ